MNLDRLRDMTNYELERSRENRLKQIKRLDKEIKVINKILENRKTAPLEPKHIPPAPARPKRKAPPLSFKPKESYDVQQ